MSNNLSINRRNQMFIWAGLGASLAIAVCLSPLASQNPDGLDRVARDLKFEDKAADDPLAHKLPFFAVFEEYALQGVPQGMATPLAGAIGTLVTFGLAWGLGKLTVRRSAPSQEEDTET
jgi:cobalt/nickel transport protein